MATEKSLGVATNKAQIELGTIDGATVGATERSSGAFTTLAASGNVTLGDAVTDTVGFYGTTPTAQRSLAAQNTTLLTTASSTAIDTLTKAAIIEIMNTLAALGLWKGAA
jgi:hypothetical protein